MGIRLLWLSLCKVVIQSVQKRGAGAERRQQVGYAKIIMGGVQLALFS